MNFKANYAISCFTYYEDEKAYQLTKECADYSISKKDYLMAETSYNNLGAMYYQRKDYKNAATYLRKSIEIVEQYRDHYTGDAKLNFMARGVSSYSFLVAGLTESGDAAGLFEAQNMQRSRVLTETLSHNRGQKKSITLEEFQQSLKQDEAAVIYSLMDQGTAIINLVTPTSTFAIQNARLDLFVALKQKYLDKINAAANKPGYKPVTIQSNSYQSNTTLAQQISKNDYEEIMELTRELLQNPDPGLAQAKNEFLRAYFDFLIKPIYGKLGTTKKLIIMPEGIFNFLPFESLMTREGKYLIEHYDIRYAQSAEVKHLIENRVYGNRQKSLLAMGGATYENMTETAERIRGADRLLELQSRARLNAESGKPQREIFAALGFGQMNYLPGTLNEVKEIEKYFNGRADVVTGTQMTENYLKSLSKSGALKNYKIVHLATHGFAIPQIPQLSGIAMCIFPKMQGGEDGFLTAPEISQLGMQADLAVLSACETGLGKIYGGEGVSGLTQSLLVGGANAAIVSLWPVSDQGTMYFMTGLYDLTENQGKKYDEAVNIMKRKFIAGEFGAEFQSTEIWAPFVHYGK
jgi:CHAT domain-containing protein